MNKNGTTKLQSIDQSTSWLTEKNKIVSFIKRLRGQNSNDEAHTLLEEAASVIESYTQQVDTIDKNIFTGCVFHGNPPPAFHSWNDWAAQMPLTGVMIETIKEK